MEEEQQQLIDGQEVSPKETNEDKQQTELMLGQGNEWWDNNQNEQTNGGILDKKKRKRSRKDHTWIEMDHLAKTEAVFLRTSWTSSQATEYTVTKFGGDFLRLTQISEPLHVWSRWIQTSKDK